VQIDPQSTIVQASYNNGIVNGTSQENQVGLISAVNNAVEVYLVDRLTAQPGGGITHNCGTSGAFVILEIEKAYNNKYLLAHELGHVLGLTHPGIPPSSAASCKSYRTGSACSVMVPDKPNSSRNTLNNIGVIEDAANPLPMGPVLTSLNQLGGWNPNCSIPNCPQKFFHIIRDFPYDDGVEPSVPQLPAADWWTYSDVWNSDKEPQVGVGSDPNNKYANGTNMFAPDHSPIHTQPTYSGLNQIYARLHTCENLTPPVNVYLYLANPGAASASLYPLPGSPLVFSSTDGSTPPPGCTSSGSLPTPGCPRTKHLSWTVPNGYPAHSCVFAIATSNNEPPSPTLPPPTLTQIIADPTTYHFNDLFRYVAPDNDVAQRNLHIQRIFSLVLRDFTLPILGRGSHRPLPTWLPWVAISNPFERPATARLEIDTTQSPQLVGLILEADGKSLGDIGIGKQATVLVSDSLQSGEQMILRLRAALPADLPEGTTLPINLRFIVDDQLISGYTHLLRVVSHSEATAQVLDTLYGALRDVSAGCEASGATSLADEVKEILLREQLGVSPPSGCLGLLWTLLGGRPLNWRSELTLRAKSIKALIQKLEASNKLEYQAVCQNLYALTEVLLASKFIADAMFIEQVRELADRIQEPAGRLARQRLRT
jgi:hypothetical protein